MLSCDHIWLWPCTYQSDFYLKVPLLNFFYLFTSDMAEFLGWKSLVNIKGIPSKTGSWITRRLQNLSDWWGRKKMQFLCHWKITYSILRASVNVPTLKMNKKSKNWNHFTSLHLLTLNYIEFEILEYLLKTAPNVTM